MANTSWQRTDSFTAHAKDGSVYQIYEFTQMLNAQTIHDAGPKLEPGIKAYRLQNGDPVNRIGDGEFEIVRTSVRVTRAT